jgi:hypothetical protein
MRLKSSVVFVGLLVLLTSLGLAQTQSRTFAPQAGRLEIGPVEGLTRAWHAAPAATAIPLGSEISLRVRSRGQDTVAWTGAREVERDPGGSMARVVLRQAGEHRVTVDYIDPMERIPVRESIHFQVVPIDPRQIRISPIELSAEPVHLDPENPNASSMHYFFRDDSIAGVRQLGDAAWRTSSGRWLTLAVAVEPAGFEPLVEWRVDGEPQTALGHRIALRSFVPRQHQLAAGPPERARHASLETYQVRIQGEGVLRDALRGLLVTLRAETLPTGYEDEIVWLASTKYGACSPATGEGATFTTVFTDVYGARGQWLGIRADHATVSLDGKAGAASMWSGTLTTEAIHVGLELNLAISGGDITGQWGTVGAGELVLNRGTVSGTQVGQGITLALAQGGGDNPAILQGTLSADGTQLSGQVTDGETTGAFQVTRCGGPDLVVLFPPAGVCEIDAENRFRFTVKNAGDEPLGEITLTGQVIRGDAVIAFDMDPTGSLAAGESRNLLGLFPECCQDGDVIQVSAPRQPGECKIFNNHATCIVFSLVSP